MSAKSGKFHHRIKKKVLQLSILFSRQTQIMSFERFRANRMFSLSTFKMGAETEGDKSLRKLANLEILMAGNFMRKIGTYMK